MKRRVILVLKILGTIAAAIAIGYVIFTLKQVF